MIPQSTPTEQGSAPDLSPEEAIVSLLIASARADGSVSIHEANSIEHMVGGMQLFRGHRGYGLQKVFAAASDRIKEHGAARMVPAAAAVVPKQLRTTAFSLAIDLMLSDGRLSPKEQGFADDLRRLLHVDPDEATKIIDVLQTKNAG
jgi:hypothetical protein